MFNVGGAGVSRRFKRTRVVVETIDLDPMTPRFASSDTLDALAMDQAKYDDTLIWNPVTSEVTSVEEVDVSQSESA